MSTNLRVSVRSYLPRDTSDLLSIERRNVQNSCTKEEFLNHYAQENRHILVAEHGEQSDQTVAFMVYDICDGYLRILNLQVAPEYRERGIEVQLINKLKTELEAYYDSNERKSSLVCEVDKSDSQLLDTLSANGFEEDRSISGSHLSFNDDVYVMRYCIERYFVEPKEVDLPSASFCSPGEEPPVEASAASHETSDSQQQEPPCKSKSSSVTEIPAERTDCGSAPDNRATMPLSNLISNARRKLAELTGVEWNIATLNRRGRLVATTMPADMTDVSDIYLQTSAKIAKPKEANAAVRQFFGVAQPRSHASVLEKSARIAIPVNWVRRIHLRLGRAGTLAESFKPADTKARYRGYEEQRFGERQGDGNKGANR